jgi:hypothetical protein
MTARIPENVSAWLVDGRIVTTTGNTMPPRDPNDDDDDDEENEDGEAEPDDDLEPPVVREPRRSTLCGSATELSYRRAIRLAGIGHARKPWRCSTGLNVAEEQRGPKINRR